MRRGRPARAELSFARGEPRAPGGNAARGRIQDRSGPPPHARAALPRRAAPPCELRQLLHLEPGGPGPDVQRPDRKSTRLNSSHGYISYAVFCLKKKKNSIDMACTA